MNYFSVKSIIASKNINNEFSWFGCSFNMNIYRGCCHGCIYCDSRSSCYQIENFCEVAAKKDALNIIEKDLKSKRTAGIIGTGAMSDPYNPYEEGLELTRGALKIIDKYGFGINIITKGILVTRDIDILRSINRHSPVCVGITVTTGDDMFSRIIEPHAPVSSKRLKAVNLLSRNNIYSGILMMPILPFLNDTEENITTIVRKAAYNNAKFILPSFGLTMRNGQREYFYNKLDQFYPGLKEKYRSTFGDSYECNSPKHQDLYKLFADYCKKYNIVYKMEDIISGLKGSVKEKQISFI